MDIWEDYCYESQKRKFYNRGSLRDVACADNGNGSFISFFVHNRSWLTAAAYEAALAGSIEGVQKNGQIYEAASAKAQELGNVGFFGAENLSYQVSDGKTVKVSYQADTIAGFGGFLWVLRTEGSSKIIRPAQWIRKVKVASEIVKDTE